MKNIAVVILLVLALGVFAFDWPVAQPEPVMTFGQNKGDTLNVGINIAGKGDVVAAENGEIIFIHNQNKGLPSPLGNFLALEHEGGVDTVYGHLAGPLDVALSTYKVNKGDILARQGASGSTIGGNLFFAMIDINENEIVNPIQLLSPALKDTKKPLMEKAQLLVNNQWYPLQKNGLLPSGKAYFYAQISDRFDGNKWDVLPYEVALHLNGIEVSRLVFNSQVLNGNILSVTNRPLVESPFYSDDGALYCGEMNLVNGNHHLFLYIADFSGNSSSYDFYIKVQSL